MAEALLYEQQRQGIEQDSLCADKGYRQRGLVEQQRGLGIEPHIALIDGRRLPGRETAARAARMATQSRSGCASASRNAWADCTGSAATIRSKCTAGRRSRRALCWPAVRRTCCESPRRHRRRQQQSVRTREIQGPMVSNVFAEVSRVVSQAAQDSDDHRFALARGLGSPGCMRI